MICPKCFNQLVQATHEMQPLGNGYGTDTEYLTWEIKVCRNCNEYYLEQYSAIKLELKDIENIAKEFINLKVRVSQQSTDLLIFRKAEK